MSKTSEVFRHPRAPTWWWIYYTIETSEDFSKALAHQTSPVVLMFSADWNQACKVMKKPFREMALANKRQAVFCLVDVDKLKGIAAQYQVEALPTFVLLKAGSEKKRAVGAKVDDLKNEIENNICKV